MLLPGFHIRAVSFYEHILRINQTELIIIIKIFKESPYEFRNVEKSTECNS